MKEDDEERTQAPDIDSGYAWVISASIWLWIMIIAVITKTFGVLHLQLEELFGQSSFKTSLVAFVMCLSWVVFSPLSGFMASKWHYRWNIIIGGILATGKWAWFELRNGHIFQEL